MSPQPGGKKARLQSSPSSSSSTPDYIPFSGQDIAGHGLVTPQSHSSEEPWQRDPMAYFSEEVALHIFEVLTPADLGKCACVSKLWHRLVNDQMLWRRLFLKYRFVFPRGIERAQDTPRTVSLSKRNIQGVSTGVRRTNAQLNQPQQRQQPRNLGQQYQMSNAYQCWKAVYRLNHNWLMGQAKVTSLSILDMLKQDQLVLERLDGRHVIPSADAQSSFPPILKFKGSVIIVASPNNLVHLWRIRSSTSARPSFSGDSETSTIGCDDASQELEFWQTYIPSPAHESSEPMGRISYLALDRSTPSTTITSFVSCLTEQRVMVGYDSGHFSIFAYQDPSSIFQATDAGIPPLPPQHQLREIGNTTSLPAWSSEDRIQSAALHYPILVTCSNDGAISIYKIQDQYDPAAQEFETTTTKDPWCRLLHRLYGIASESPVEISLEQIRPGKSSQHNDDTDVATTSLSTSKETSNKGSSWRAIISFGLQLLDGSWTVRLQEIGFDNLFIHYSNETGTESAISISDGGGPNFEQQQYQPQHPSLAQHANYDDTVYGHFTNLTEMCESDFAFLSSSSATACTTPFDNQVRVGAISSMAISWPFVVTTHRDNTMNVFQMTRQRTHSDQSSKSSTASAATLGSKGASRLRLRFEHLSTLYGHCGAVSSVAIEPRSGRLVSAGMDRSIKVWALTLQPRRTQATLKSSSSSRSNYQGPSSLSTPRTHQCIVSMSDINKSWTETGKVTMEEGLGLIWVGSDEDKIVSMNCDGTVKVWQFS